MRNVMPVSPPFYQSRGAEANGKVLNRELDNAHSNLAANRKRGNSSSLSHFPFAVFPIYPHNAKRQKERKRGKEEEKQQRGERGRTGRENRV